jgi:hypothetical protein
MIHGIGLQRWNTHQPPEIGHFRNNQGEGQNIPKILLSLHVADLVAKMINHPNEGNHQPDGDKMGQGEIGEFNFCTFAEEVMKKVFHFASPGFMVCGLLHTAGTEEPGQ